MSRKQLALFEPTLVVQALKEAVKKLNPQAQWRNPVMFIVWIGSLLTTFICIAMASGAMPGNALFSAAISGWLWVTVLFANFAEALAEGRSKAQANSLKGVKKTAFARKLREPKYGAAADKVPADQLRKGDIVLVEAGDIIPCDGEVIEGGASVDESAITGESAPVIRESGGDFASVTGGTRILSDWLVIECSVNPGETFLDRMIAMVEGAQRRKTPNEIALTILLIALTIVFLLATATLWPFSAWGGNAVSVTVLVALLVCLIPTTIGGLLSAIGVAGMSRMLGANVIATSGRAVEAAADVDVLLLDKTGTITSGEPKVTDLIPAPGVQEEELLRLAFALEQKSEHPLARAILHRAEERNLSPEPVSDFQVLPGNGLTATWQGTLLQGGNYTFISRQSQVPESMRIQGETLAQAGKTPLFFAQDGHLTGIIAVADVIKEDSPQAIQELQSMGIQVVMLTGDNARTAQAIGKEAGVNHVIAGVLPDGKERVIRQLKEQGKVTMVGDGINDAPALTRADIGIAIGAGTDVAIDAADVVLMKSRLRDVPAAIRLSRATLRNIHQNLFWAFLYNTIGIPLAAGVFIPLGLTLNPMFGAAAMSLSSFCVVTNALRLNLFRMHDGSKDKKIKSISITVKEQRTMEKTMKIEGMMCTHCEARVKKALEALDAVEQAKVSHEAGTAVVTLSEDVTDDVLKNAVEAQDYPVTSIQ